MVSIRPSWTYAQVKLDHFPKVWDKNSKNLWNHHLDLDDVIQDSGALIYVVFSEGKTTKYTKPFMLDHAGLLLFQQSCSAITLAAHHSQKPKTKELHGTPDMSEGPPYAFQEP